MKWDWLWSGSSTGGGMWSSEAPRSESAPASQPAIKRVKPSLIIRLAWPIVLVLVAYEKVPFWTVVVTWPLIEILRRVDVIAKTHFKVDVDEE